ncbi:YpoC family protein [Mesobacillus zeae]
MGGCIIAVPEELLTPFFFPDESMEWKEEYSSGYFPEITFIHEAAHYAGLNSMKPWEHREDAIPSLLAAWGDTISSLRNHFKERKPHETKMGMKQATGLFLQYLFWTNGNPVCFPLAKIEKLPGKPVNVHERLSFILSRPTLYHSFIQLEELMKEQEKQYAKLKLSQ